MSTFADVLRDLRSSRSLTQEELAERAGITVKAVSALERGERRRPYPHTVRSLADGLGLDEHERSRLVAAVPGRSTSRTTSGRAASSLPGLHGPLFGRESDVAVIAGLLTERVRPVVTVTGPGGVGKTALALTVAQLVADTFPGGVSLVDLAAIRDPRAVLTAVATAVGVPEGGYDGSAASLAPYLENRRLLLVLDNLEQVLDCAPQLAELVTHNPDLALLATSRAPLRIRAEREHRLAPLDEADAIRLFVERAQAAGSDLQTAEADGTLAALCRQADGLPLAIELWASAASTLGPRALLDRLGGLAAEGPRDLPPRQRSIEATLDWSVDLLQTDARDLLGEVAVLAGSFTQDAADAVARRPAVDGLRTLLEHSLLTRVDEVAGVTRYRLLEPVRQYAARRWPEQDPARHALGSYVRDEARARAADLRGSNLVAGLDLLDADLANLASGMTNLVEWERYDDAAEVLRHTWLHQALRGYARLGHAWLDLVRDRPMADHSRASWMVAQAGLAHLAGDIPALRRTSSAALDLARLAGDDLLAAEAVVLGGYGAVFAGDLSAAASLIAEQTPLVDVGADGFFRTQFGIVRSQLALVSGDLDDAESLLVEVVEQARELGNVFTLAVTLNVFAILTEMRGHHEQSAVLLGEATELSADASITWSLAYSLPALAGVAVRIGDPATGARLFGASASYAAQHGVATSFQAMQELVARDLGQARQALGEDAFRAQWDGGRTATMDDVADLARAVTDRARD